MLRFLKASSLDALMSETIPEKIRTTKALNLPAPATEHEALNELRAIASQNRVFRSYIGMGYSDCIVPGVIQRNILENPGWYTQYTPYQAEIAQGRLEALLNFQTLIIDLTGLPVANASLLDEGTAAAEAMALCFAATGRDVKKKFLVADTCHPQTIEVLLTRAEPLGIEVQVASPLSATWNQPAFGILLQYPDTLGEVTDWRPVIQKAKDSGAMAVLAADPLALTVLASPGELGADIAIGSTQRFGVPMGFGGPHAAYMAVRDEHKRLLPGRIVGVSKDADGQNAIRLALQTREQHIRRDKATSNICTAQVLLAVMASMYAVYHGPEGLKEIATRLRVRTARLRAALQQLGFTVIGREHFDTLTVQTNGQQAQAIHSAALKQSMNFRIVSSDRIGVALDETTSDQDVVEILSIFSQVTGKTASLPADANPSYAKGIARTTAYLTHPVFNTHHSETEMLRYIRKLEAKDLSLTTSMIPLGSCTMKLNATAEMFPVSWPEFSKLHPFAPADQTRGYREMFTQLENWLSEITGFSATSLQPNAGSQGEYAGLLVIRAYHQNRGEGHRNVCLIPKSAHGTNPASAAMAGMQIVVVECDSQGNIDLADLRAKSQAHAANLAALMMTYPSTHGVFEESVVEVCEIVHKQGGQVYMDGANMNAQVGLCRPGDFGADVCHLNLHKTFCIPHGGGGPGMGPIAVRSHLAEFLPRGPNKTFAAPHAIGPISAAPWGSASILVIPWMYIRMMGPEGLKAATQVAILNANYLAKKLEPHFPVLYVGSRGRVAHECIFDLRPLKEKTGVDVEDLAKRLMDYGFHAPTISFPVAGTLMVEPTESEGLAELDRFVTAMTEIRKEIAEIETGKADRQNNVLKLAPHTATQVTATEWKRPYTREKAAFPAPYLRAHKFWPPSARINNVMGDRQLICACPPMEDYLPQG